MPSLNDLKTEYDLLCRKLANAGALDRNELKRVSSRQAELREIMDIDEKINSLKITLAENESILSEDDREMRALAEEEITRIKKELSLSEKELRVALSPKDEYADKDVVLEIRAGTGGDEASLFAADLLRMYTRFAESKGFKTRLVDENRSETGGFKEVIIEMKGKGCYNSLKYESGVHRVQRIPETEKIGRIHTSTATVAVLPKAEIIDIEIKPEDIRVDTYRAGGHGGQNVQKTSSAVRITHIPTGTVAQSQNERGQAQNKEAAMEVLRTRLLAKQIEDEEKAHSSERRSQIGTGDRSEKIRTYNFPQDRVTDHRIKESWHGINRIMDGEIENVVDKLRETEEEKNLSS